MIRQKMKIVLMATLLLLGFSTLAQAETLKPFVLGNTPPGSMADVVRYAGDTAGARLPNALRT